MTRRDLILSAAAAVPAALSAAPSSVEVHNVRRAFHNGEHNAFTDLVRFQGRLYLTFRSCPDGHMVHPTSRILILQSDDDGATWTEVHRFSVSKRDVRDPHFLVFQSKLFVYSGTWYCGDSSPDSYDHNQQLGYGVSTSDGKRWTEPRMLEGTYGHYIWRAAAHGGKAYLCGRRKHGFAVTATRAERDPIVESALLVSGDGWNWTAAGLFQEAYGNETAFVFEDDGALLAVARRGDNRTAQLLRSRPPFRDWQRSDLGQFIGGPMVVKWGDRTLVGGRNVPRGDRRTTLYWLEDGALRQCAQLPSGGDNSYPGFVEFTPHSGLLSYYSTHEEDASGNPFTAIYLAELRYTARR